MSFSTPFLDTAISVLASSVAELFFLSPLVAFVTAFSCLRFKSYAFSLTSGAIDGSILSSIDDFLPPFFETVLASVRGLLSLDDELDDESDDVDPDDEEYGILDRA